MKVSSVPLNGPNTIPTSGLSTFSLFFSPRLEGSSASHRHRPAHKDDRQAVPSSPPRWAFAEFTEVFQIAADFKAKVESELNKMIATITNGPSEGK
jgi:hypothetical protein